MGNADEDELLYDDVDDDDQGAEPAPKTAAAPSDGNAQAEKPARSAPAAEAPAADAPTAVYVSGLTWWTTDVEVETYCSEYGKVREVTFFAEKSNGKSKGTACVEFEDAAAAKACHDKLIYKRINGRDLTVKYVPVAAAKTAGGEIRAAAAKPPDTAWKGPVPGQGYGGAPMNPQMMQQQQMMMMQRQQMMMMQRQMMKGGMGVAMGNMNRMGAPGMGGNASGNDGGAAKRPRQH